jgi:L-cysteine S-thiosulfotransferase
MGTYPLGFRAATVHKRALDPRLGQEHPRMNRPQVRGSFVRAIFAVLVAVCGVPVLAQVAKEGPAPLEMDKPASPMPWKRYANWTQSDWKDYNTLRDTRSPEVPGELTKIGAITDGDAERGKKLFGDRSKGGSCMVCHVVPGASFPGNVGPELSTYRTKGRSDSQIYNYILDPRQFNPVSMMPPWGTNGILNDQEIKDLVAYLKTLKEPAKLSDLDNPATRPLPKSTVDYHDPTENPAMFEVDRGKKHFDKAGPAGKSCASCHKNPEQAFKTWAAHMPYYEPRMKKVLNSEEFLTRHARATTGENWPMESEENTALSIYVRNFADGQPIDIQFRTPEEKAAAEKGKELMDRKVGQLNFKCNDCHGQAANHWMRGQYVLGIKNQVGHHPYWRTSQGEIWTLRKRFQWCGVAVRSNELPPDASEYGYLEYYLTSLSNGKAIDGPGIGH